MGEPGSLGSFARLLKQAGVLDLEVVQLPGAAVVLPFGMRLLRRFRSRVEAALDSKGFEEHEYPALTSTESLAALTKLFPIRDLVLRVGNDSDFASGEPRAALLPSGEAAIYSHWRRRLRVASDLPLRIYRRAQYFRPAPAGHHSGRSLFRQMEAADIYEIHCAYASAVGREQGVCELVALVQSLCEQHHLPVEWSLRPPWTNREAVADGTLAADLFLPTGKALQIAAVYDQGTRWSEVFGVGLRTASGWKPAEQVSAYVSRRLIWAHLMLSVRGQKLAVHPDVAPTQVALIYQSRNMGDDPIASLAKSLEEVGRRVSMKPCYTPSEPAAALRECSRHGVPVAFFIQDRRHPEDPFKVVEQVAHREDEIILRLAELTTLVDRVQDLLNAAAIDWQSRARTNWACRRAQASVRSELAEHLERRRLASCPLAPTKAAVLALERAFPGEVLGFTSMITSQPCIITGATTETRALVARRV